MDKPNSQRVVVVNGKQYPVTLCPSMEDVKRVNAVNYSKSPEYVALTRKPWQGEGWVKSNSGGYQTMQIASHNTDCPCWECDQERKGFTVRERR